MDDDRVYCAYCLHQLGLSDEMECDKCGTVLYTHEFIEHATMLRRKADAEREFNRAKELGLFK